MTRRTLISIQTKLVGVERAIAKSLGYEDSWGQLKNNAVTRSAGATGTGGCPCSSTTAAAT
jgi:hypothetical protein